MAVAITVHLKSNNTEVVLFTAGIKSATAVYNSTGSTITPVSGQNFDVTEDVSTILAEANA